MRIFKAYIVTIVCSIVCSMFFTLNASAQKIDTIFAHVPHEVLPLLDNTSRLDMIDLYNNKMSAAAENVYGGQSVMEEKTNDYISIKLTDVSHWQLKLLPMAHDTLYACVHSIVALGTSSTLNIYKKDWHVAKVDVPQIKFEHFLTSKELAQQSKYHELIEILRNTPITIKLDKDDYTLTYSLSKESLPKELKDMANKVVKDITYRWQLGKFILVTK